jgi:hypothetical protein
MHAINLLSYNLNFNAAYSELTELALTHTAELVCLQECYADTLTAMIAGLALAAKTTTGKLGLAIYCDSSRFTVIGSSSIPICLSTYSIRRIENDSLSQNYLTTSTNNLFSWLRSMRLILSLLTLYDENS